jgi:hypothetical protein
MIRRLDNPASALLYWLEHNFRPGEYMKFAVALLLFVGSAVHADLAAITGATVTFAQNITTGSEKDFDSGLYTFTVDSLNGSPYCKLIVSSEKPNVTFAKGSSLVVDFSDRANLDGDISGSDRQVQIAGGWAPDLNPFITTSVGVSTKHAIVYNETTRDWDETNTRPVAGVLAYCMTESGLISTVSGLKIPSEAGLIKLASAYVVITETREK